ncbi:MAG: hypothetical protein GF383_14210, partial [Candidatus Lokiarchaeota archaeon]|nr:hypothetical protein [Candidatus Lokiarchaeota archaeon]MBD3342511.1 hypothetical protein [Candidatus Lokiarchaeota archaeon]
MSVIRVTPVSGVYYDNNLLYQPKRSTEGEYWFVDGNLDATYETVLIIDNDGEVIGVGFDYDQNNYFQPDKHIKVELNLIKFDESDNNDSGKFKVMDLVGNRFLTDRLHDEDSLNGYALEPAFSDALFDLWKIKQDGTSSELIQQVSQLTFDQYIESLTAERVACEALWQIEAGVVASIVGGLTQTGPVGFFATYATLNIMYSWLSQEAVDNLIKSREYESDKFRGTRTLSGKYFSDNWMGNSWINLLTGTMLGAYVPVAIQTEQYRYEGEIVLSPSGEFKMNKIGFDIYNPHSLDYNLAQRNYFARYSDFHKLLGGIDYLFDVGEMESIDDDRLIYSKNSIGYLEDAIYTSSKVDSQARFNKVAPYMFNGYPIMMFVESNEYTQYPEFYEDFPIFASDASYNNNFASATETVYKVWEEGSDTIEIRPSHTGYFNSRYNKHTIKCDVEEVRFVLLYKEEGNSETYHTFLRKLESSEFSYDSDTGDLVLTESLIQELENQVDEIIENAHNSIKESQILCEIDFKRYAPSGDALSEINGEIPALMQGVHGGVLEYYYQFVLAQQAQQQLNDMVYTICLTALTVMVTMSITADLATKSASEASTSFAVQLAKAVGEEILEEVFIDELIESLVTGIAADLGADAYEQIFWSTLISGLRESAGPMGRQFYGSTQIDTQVNIMHSPSFQISLTQQQQQKSAWKQKLEQSKSRAAWSQLSVNLDYQKAASVSATAIQM